MALIARRRRKSGSFRRAAARSLDRLGGGSVLGAAEDPNVQRVLGVMAKKLEAATPFAVIKAVPVVRLPVLQEGRKGRVPVSSVKYDEHIVGEIFRIEQHRKIFFPFAAGIAPHHLKVICVRRV